MSRSTLPSLHFNSQPQSQPGWLLDSGSFASFINEISLLSSPPTLFSQCCNFFQWSYKSLFVGRELPWLWIIRYTGLGGWHLILSIQPLTPSQKTSHSTGIKGSLIP
eukprot:TRINITY_DN5597_c0_g2_i14.p2 TRINITY_DN5597_c0_g2~~TRINITY_DN5597_c0_g2_i14.p2  ORF type:complete len:107 (-),score=7.67 TRINITY_DN5597_c0_g2_i14:60-380(-)